MNDIVDARALASPDPEPRAELGPSERAAGLEDHDVLIFPNSEVIGSSESFRIPIVKKSDGSGRRLPGEYRDTPEHWDLRDFGQRRAVSIARPHQANGGAERGPGFSVLPIKPEPAATSVGTCFLINARNLATPNLWTVEEWNDDPLGVDILTPEHPKEFEVLIAGPWAQVFRLSIRHQERWPEGPISIGSGRDAVGEIERLDLRNESEIWSELRNGCVAGRVWFESGGRVVPLVNVTALEPLPKSSSGNGEGT